MGTIVSEYHHENSYSFDAFFDNQKEFDYDDEDLFDDNDEEDDTNKKPKSSRGGGAPSKPKSFLKRKEVHLDKVGDIVLIAEGGQPGVGNSVLAGSKHQQHSLVSSSLSLFVCSMLMIVDLENSPRQRFQVN